MSAKRVDKASVSAPRADKKVVSAEREVVSARREEKSETLRGPPSRRAQEITEHLYRDAQTRKNKTSQPDSKDVIKEKSVQQSKSNISKQNQILATGIKAKLVKCLADLRLESKDFSKFITGAQCHQILTHLKYLNDDLEPLSNDLIKICQDNYGAISLENLYKGILAIENIFLASMKQPD